MCMKRILSTLLGALLISGLSALGQVPELKSIPFSHIRGISVGNAQNDAAGTGVTVFRLTEPSLAAVEIFGGGPASRETEVIAVERNHPINALVFSGGSAFGLAASSGVSRCLEEHGVGYETGSALVYAGFIFVLYREGLSGWWLAAIGLIILLFVGTLTAGAYTTLLIMIGILLLSCSLSEPSRMKKRLLLGGGFVLLMALFPLLLGWIGDLVQGEMDKLALRPWVPQADETEDYFWGFILKIKPVWVLIGLTFAALPFLLWQAYKIKDKFLALCCGVFIAGTIMVFSTDFVFQNVLQPHQRGRIEVLLGLKEDLAGVGYNVNQSKIAIGSGGLLGKGFLKGTQTTFGFVPEQSTDFIFCTVGEEWGFLGCLIVISLYVWLIARLIMDAERCRGKFTRIYGYCVAACIFMHLFINVGMTVGLMPVIGIPLPLLSYGGSSLWAFTILIFIFLALYRNEKKYF